MDINTVRNIIKKEIQRKGYELEERKSTTSESWYYKIYNGNNSLMFRISDHKTNSNIITLRVDKKLNRKTLDAFIRNRCDGLSRRVLDSFLLK